MNKRGFILIFNFAVFLDLSSAYLLANLNNSLVSLALWQKKKPITRHPTLTQVASNVWVYGITE